MVMALNDSLMRQQVVRHWQGEVGEPLPYRLRNDDFVTSVLLLNLVLLIWTVMRARTYLQRKLKGIFHTSETESMFALQEGTEERGVAWFLLPTCFFLSLLGLTFLQAHVPAPARSTDPLPYAVIAVLVVLSGIFYTLKGFLYRFVNVVFFDTEATHHWHEAYQLSILAVGCGLAPIALLEVYFDLPQDYMLLSAVAVLIFVKLMLFLKALQIFSPRNASFFHILLYFCTLELLPTYFIYHGVVRVLHEIYINGLDLTSPAVTIL